MLESNVKELINEQINLEFYSGYLYLDFSNYYNEIGLDGFANWYEVQAKEELDHAILLRKYLHNNDEKVVFDAIAQPKATYKTAKDPLQLGIAHEQAVTKKINKIYAAADEAHDYRTMQCFDWFVKEQGEEEKNSQDLLKKFELYGSDPKGLYALNQELLARVYNPPSLVL